MIHLLQTGNTSLRGKIGTIVAHHYLQRQYELHFLVRYWVVPPEDKVLALPVYSPGGPRSPQTYTDMLSGRQHSYLTRSRHWDLLGVEVGDLREPTPYLAEVRSVVGETRSGVHRPDEDLVAEAKDCDFRPILVRVRFGEDWMADVASEEL